MNHHITYYIDRGDTTFPCEYCGALLRYAETLRRATDALDESYSICFNKGKVTLARGQVDDTVNYGRGPFCYRIHGENYHRLGSLLSETGKTTKFAQLCIFDTENEITNKIKVVSKEQSETSKDKKLDRDLATEVRDMLDSINPLVKEFRMADGEEVDEIKDFYDCRYLSACEAAWRVYGFDIHCRTPPVERLPFHLKDEQSIIFDATESIDYTLEKSSVNETKFVLWMELNKTNTLASTLLYAEIPNLEYIEKDLECKMKGFVLGTHSSRTTILGELFYLKILLNTVKGPKDWLELKSFDNIVYATYRDACYARGLLQDDKEYIDGLMEASE
nr:hypothetical protein [Tanacetum cinerariifolium]